MSTNLRLPEGTDKRKPRRVAEAIIDAIRDGAYGTDDKLPAERELASRLGVSRGVVREALTALQIAGVVQIRTGEGSFVKTPYPFEDSAAHAVQILEQNDSPLDLWEARRELEITLVRHAANLAGAADVAAVREALDAMSVTASRQDLEAYLVANARFHKALLAPVENNVLQRIAGNLIASTNQLLTLESVHRYLSLHLTASLRKHQAILNAYVARDAEAIREAIAHHFSELEAFYLEA